MTEGDIHKQLIAPNVTNPGSFLENKSKSHHQRFNTQIVTDESQRIYTHKDPVQIKPYHYNQGMASFGAHHNQFYRNNSSLIKKEQGQAVKFMMWRDKFERDFTDNLEKEHKISETQKEARY
tara:strand:- start:145 stop:510 length:366 start_codon:yes stop_codon:yes gene_type:complete